MSSSDPESDSPTMMTPGGHDNAPDGTRLGSGTGPASTPSTEDVTRQKPAASPRTPTSSRTPLSGSGLSTGTSSRDGGQFPPGTVVADRYRIVGLLGRGGMGEVYRAEDLRLDQTVALKFLTEAVMVDPGRLAQFHNEVRIARQVTHKNVCRMYDLGELDGRPFLSMEYVDGEDLASLLRRIGRLPQDKAIEIARQLCAGLASAHERGVVHRDLKPANVMIDGDGHVRLTDFGIAGAAEHGDSRAGTPAYMAPEQLLGQGISTQTDLFALGLVLYEMFTGKRAVDVKTVNDLVRLHEQGLQLSASRVVPDLDPSIDRVIRRCLERDPRDRPPSALAISAALPGGDPLAAALAAGETPSPEMVAASGRTSALPAWRALVLLGTFVLILVSVAAFNDRFLLFRRLPFDKPPAVLVDRAQTTLETLGYREPFADSVWAFDYQNDFLRYVVQNRTSADRWSWLATGDTPAMLFVYRASPRALVPFAARPRPSSADPPLNISGMVTVVLDTRGRLLEFHAVPPQKDVATSDATAPATAPNWDALFAAAGLDRRKFVEVVPEWTPRTYADARAAWTGRIEQLGGIPLRVEAATYRGRPVYFGTIGPWARPTRMEERPRTTGERWAIALASVMVAVIFIAAALFARANARSGRGDRTGATRLAVAVFGIALAGWVLTAHYAGDAATALNRFIQACAFALFEAGLLWVLYMALEPIVRRRWPDSLVGWTRLLAGKWRDPLVGRDVLIGCVAGIAFHQLIRAARFLPVAFGQPPPVPFIIDPDGLLGPHLLVGSMFNAVSSVLATALVIILLFTVVRLVIRWPWVAFAISTVLFTLLIAGELVATDATWIGIPIGLAISALLTGVAWRFGLVVLTALLFVNQVLYRTPVITDLTTWYAGVTLAGVVLLLGLATYGFITSRAGEPIFGKHIA